MNDFVLNGGSPLPGGWTHVTAGDLRRKRSVTFNPAFAKHDVYQLWSIPSHALDTPEVQHAHDIRSNKQHVAPGDVLISKINPRLNRTWVVGSKQGLPQIASTEWTVFPRSEGVNSQFLAILLSDSRIRDFLTANASGVGGSLTRVKPALFDRIQLPIPPLEEQIRIVKKLENLFVELDRGFERLQAAKTAINLYRYSVLKAAFEGRLTAEWRAQNTDKIEAPDAFMARIHAECEREYKNSLYDWECATAEWEKVGEKRRKPARPKRPRAVPAKPVDIGIVGWISISLGMIIGEPIYGTPKKCSYGFGTKCVLRIPNIGSGIIDTTDLKSADFDEYEIDRFSLTEGDVLTVRSNGSLSIVGKSALVGQQHTSYLFAGYLIRLRAIRSLLDPKYLVYLMMGPKIRAQIETKAKSTSGVNNISAKELQELDIPLCAPAEQAEIVRILDMRLEAAKLLDAEVDVNLALAGALRQAVLKKAFAGELVPQNPEDEFATALLERIRSEHRRTRTTSHKRRHPK